MNRFIIAGCIILLFVASVVFIFRKQIRYIIKPKIQPEAILKKSVDKSPEAVNILFLHHSTGNNIWMGGVEPWFTKYRFQHQKAYFITEQHFPVEYGNNPYDYWNIWVNHAGQKPYYYEPTLEMIAEEYSVVVFKHCFPVSGIDQSDGKGDVSSDKQTLENYKLQYNALRKKLLGFPEIKFILWTGASLVKGATSPDQAGRARQFFNWVRKEWDQPGDNIFLWDFQMLETEGGLFLLDTNAEGPTDSHPNKNFSQQVAPFFCQRIVDVIEGRGDSGEITGKQSTPNVD
jgi:hypothetical protein